MRTRLLQVDPLASGLSDHPAIREAADVLRAGALVAFPTETVYGLGGDATSEEAVEAIFAAKERPADNPLIVHLADLGDVERYARVDGIDTARLDKLLRHFWPGPLTVVLPARDAVRPAARGLDTVGLRMPDHPIALALIHAAGVPLAAPSANRSGRPSPTRASHVGEDLEGRIPLILDGGECRVGIESTVLDLSRGTPTVLRPGAVGTEQISALWEETVTLAESDDPTAAPRSPGTRYRHYSPRAAVVLLARDLTATQLAQAVETLSAEYECSRKDAGVFHLTLRSAGTDPAGEASQRGLTRRVYADAESFMRHLYADFRAADAAGARLILVDASGDEAIDDRLRRAASRSLDAGDLLRL